MEHKYSKILTIVIIISVIAILGLLSYFGYDYYKKYVIERDKNEYLNEYNKEVEDQNSPQITLLPDSTSNNTNPDSTPNSTDGEFVNPLDRPDYTPNNNSSAQSTPKVSQYKGFNVLGQITIPAINLDYPILERATKSSLEVSVAVQHGPRSKRDWKYCYIWT